MSKDLIELDKKQLKAEINIAKRNLLENVDTLDFKEMLPSPASFLIDNTQKILELGSSLATSNSNKDDQNITTEDTSLASILKIIRIIND